MRHGEQKHSGKTTGLSGVWRWSLLTAVLLSVGCVRTVSVPMKVAHPPMCDLSRHRNLALGEFEGKQGTLLRDYLKTQLMESPYFTLVAHGDLLQREQELIHSDLADEATAEGVDLTRRQPADAVLSARFDVTYHETTKREAYVDKKTNEKGVKITRSGWSDVDGFLKVSSARDGSLIHEKSLTAKTSGAISKQAKNEMPPSPRREVMNMALAFGKLVAWATIHAREERIYVPFRAAGGDPESKQAINLAKIGEYGDALEIFERVITRLESAPDTKPAVLADAYWNLGLLHRYTEDLDAAEQALKKARSIKSAKRIDKQLEGLRQRRRQLAEAPPEWRKQLAPAP